MFHVPNNADDLTHPGLFIAHAPARLDVFAEHVLPRKKFLGEALIHYDDGKRVKLIRLLEDPALQERDTHRLEIIHSGDTHGSVVPLSFRQRMLSHDESVTKTMLVFASGTDSSTCLECVVKIDM